MRLDVVSISHSRLTSIAAFLVPALVLWLPSGYAYGSAILLLGGLWTISTWSKSKATLSAGYRLALIIVIMAGIWLLGSDWGKGIAVLNRPVRYLLILPCLYYVLCYPPRIAYFLNGILVGAAAGGVYAVFDVTILKVGRAWTTVHSTANVIQLGDLSGLLGMLCWLQVALFWKRWSILKRGAAIACGILGLVGSLLSQSRGGWVGLLICLPFLMFIIARHISIRRASAGFLAAALLLLPLSLYFSGILKTRIDEAVAQAIAYQRIGASETSVGQRLFMWKQAFEMGLQKPLLGWGDTGYTKEKIRQVEVGKAPGMELDYKDAHNDMIDMFAKRGIVGLIGLLLQYTVPFLLFWPRRGKDFYRSKNDDLDQDRRLEIDIFAMRAIGVAIPVAFAGFGLTQTYFSHYNGINMYWLMIILVYAILHKLSEMRARDECETEIGRSAGSCDKLKQAASASVTAAGR